MATRSNAALLQAAVSHQVGLGRYGTAVAARAVTLLNSLDDELLSAVEDVRPTSGSSVTSALAVIKRVNTAAIDLVGGYLGPELVSLAESEAGGEAATLGSGAGLSDPTAAALRAVVYSQPFQGGLLREWVAGMDAGRFTRLRQAVRHAVALGESSDALVRRVQGSSATGYRDGILDISRRSAVSITRTAVAHVASAAREAYWAANADLVRGVRWVSVLDSRTTAGCASYDGRVFELGKGPRPPLHINALGAGTLIETKRGRVKIEDVVPGDLVLTHRRRWRPVYATMSKLYEKATLAEVNLSTGGVLRVTDEHPLLRSGVGWQSAGNLDIGDELFQHPGYVMEGCLSVPSGNSEPDNCPPLFDSHEIFSEICGESVRISVLPTVDFKNNSILRERKVRDRVGELVLMDKIDATIPEEVNKDHLGLKLLLSLYDSHTLVETYSYLRDERRIIIDHPLSLGDTPGVAFTSVVMCGASSKVREVLDTVHDRLMPCPDPDTESLTCTVNSSELDAELDAETVDGSVLSVVPLTNKLLEDISIGKIEHQEPLDWVVAKPTLIARVHSGQGEERRVYNLAVLEDETYLAEGVIVHNCRSTTVAVLRGEADAPRLTYADWFSALTATEQDEILGPTRAKLYRSGGLALGKFVDRSGLVYDLTALRQRQAAAFTAAGL